MIIAQRETLPHHLRLYFSIGVLAPTGTLESPMCHDWLSMLSVCVNGAGEFYTFSLNTVRVPIAPALYKGKKNVSIKKNGHAYLRPPNPRLCKRICVAQAFPPSKSFFHEYLFLPKHVCCARNIRFVCAKVTAVFRAPLQMPNTLFQFPQSDAGSWSTDMLL